jgi:four helix bundle protein
MGEIKSHRDLRAWQMAFALGKRSIKATNTFPKFESTGLANQVRRSGVSVPSNIAEEFGRGTPGDFLRFLRMSRGSLFELDTQLLMAKEHGFISSRCYESLNADWNEVSKVLAGLIRAIETPRKPRSSANHESRIANHDKAARTQGRRKG